MKVIDVWHPLPASEQARLHQRRLIVAFSYFNILISAVYIFANVKMGIDFLWVNPMQIFGSIVTLVTLRFSRNHMPAAHIFLGLAALNLVTLVTLFHGFPYTILMWVPVYALVAVYVLGSLLGAAWTALTLTLLALAVGFGEGWLTRQIPVNPDDYRAITIISMFLTGTAALAASLLFARSIKKLSDSVEQQNIELKNQNATIAQYAQDKSLLVSIVCHDIANPLTLAVFYSEKIQEDPAHAETYIPKVVKGLKAIEAITVSVRDFEAIDSGKKAVKIQPVNLKDIFELARITFAQRLAEKSLTLEFSVPDSINTWVLAEETSLGHSIVNNLISNAIKFSQENQKIVCSVDEEDEFVVLRVRDYGIGMTEDAIPHIFDKRSPTTGVGTRGERGTGFGLPITKALMDRFGGRIECLSRDARHFPSDHGTTFVLKFRKAQAA
jgi:signal transduction histidine kinase